MFCFMTRAFSARAAMFFATTVWAIATNCLAGRPCMVDDAPAAKLVNESRIAAALADKTELDFADQPLSDVIDYLKLRHDIEIKLDGELLTDARAVTGTPITYAIKGVTLQSALDLTLGPLNLAWVIHDEVLFITSKAKVRKMVVTRVYPVRDLLTGTAGGLPPGDGESDYESLVECVAEAAAPDDGPPDPRSVHIYRPAGALVITRPILVHYRIEKLLRNLRRARALRPPK